MFTDTSKLLSHLIDVKDFQKIVFENKELRVLGKVFRPKLFLKGILQRDRYEKAVQNPPEWEPGIYFSPILSNEKKPIVNSLDSKFVTTKFESHWKNPDDTLFIIYDSSYLMNTYKVDIFGNYYGRHMTLPHLEKKYRTIEDAFDPNHYTEFVVQNDTVKISPENCYIAFMVFPDKKFKTVKEYIDYRKKLDHSEIMMQDFGEDPSNYSEIQNLVDLIEKGFRVILFTI